MGKEMWRTKIVDGENLHHHVPGKNSMMIPGADPEAKKSKGMVPEIRNMRL